MNTQQREITVALFKWNVNKPILPKLKPSIYRKEFEADYEKYKVDKSNYLLCIDAHFEKYPVVKCEMRNFATKQMDESYEEANRNAAKLVGRHMQPLLSESIKKMHATFYSMLSTQEQVLSLYSSCNYESHIAHKLLDIKNEKLMRFNEYIHAGLLYGSEMLDAVFGELMDTIDELKTLNTDSIKKLEEEFTNNLDRYESLAAALGVESSIHVIDIHENGWMYIKKVPFDMNIVTNDLTRLYSLL